MVVNSPFNGDPGFHRGHMSIEIIPDVPPRMTFSITGTPELIADIVKRLKEAGYVPDDEMVP